MYKGASENLQGRADRSNIVDLALSDARSEVMPLRTRHENLQKVLHNLDAHILTLRKGSPERKDAGLRKFELQEEMKKLRAVLPNPRANLSDQELFAQIFKDEAFRILPRSHFDRVMEAAKRSYDEAIAERTEAANTQERPA